MGLNELVDLRLDELVIAHDAHSEAQQEHHVSFGKGRHWTLLSTRAKG